jgi:hypothetical protein
MPAHYPVPTHDAIRGVLAQLTGRDVKVSPKAAVALDPQVAGVVADFSLDEGDVAALWIADAPLSNAIGTALNQNDGSEAEPVADPTVVNDAAVQQLRQVADAVGLLLNSVDTPAVHVRDMHRMPGALPAEANELVARPSARRSFEVSIGDLGQGTLSMLVG